MLESTEESLKKKKKLITTLPRESNLIDLGWDPISVFLNKKPFTPFQGEAKLEKQ